LAQGTEQSVESLRAAALRAFHTNLVVPNNCVLAIFGDIKPTSVRAAVEKRFHGWRPNRLLRPATPQPVPAKPQRVTESRDKKQAVLVIGYPGLALADPDRYALEMLQEACSDLGSRLFVRIREKLGLAYYVGAQNFPGLVPGYFAFYVGTDPSKAGLVEQELLAEAEELRKHGLTAEELHRAKAKIIGHKKIARQDLGDWASTTALDELYGLGYRHADAEDALYEAVTLEEVRAAARKYLRPESVVVALIQPETGSRDSK